MNRQTILKPTGCDIRRLPLGAREAFFASQIDGHMSLEEIAQVASIELHDAVSLAKRLVELGVASVGEASRAATPKRGAQLQLGEATERGARVQRIDPRAERDSIRPQARVTRQPSATAMEEAKALRPAPGDSRSKGRAKPTQLP